ncbi:MAG TPA: hypothetical protein VGI85_06815 [Chthoniobacterales bacterium]|jgi:hypothetical protein
MPNKKETQHRAAATQDKKATSSYRCPMCGESVDGSNYDAFRLHHDHVLHPSRFHFRNSSTTAGAATQNGM